jgi:hypothetical protein
LGLYTTFVNFILMESRKIIEATGQIVTVHKGWTISKKPDELEVESASTGHSRTTPYIPHESSAAHPAPLSKAPRGRQLKPFATRTFEFVDGSDPIRNRDPDVRKLVRAHAMRDSARKKKQRKDLPKDLQQEDDRRLLPALRTDDVQDVPNAAMTVFGEPKLSETHVPRWIIGEVERSYQIIPFARDLDPSLSAVVHDLINVSSRMYPNEGAFKLNPLSPAHWFHFAQSDQALYHALQYTSATYQSLYDGEKQSKRAALEMAQCMHLLNDRLSDVDDIADGTIGATSCLALVEVIMIRA